MAATIALGGIHHVRLTVTDVARSRSFYTTLFGFDVAAEVPPVTDPTYEAVSAALFGGVILIKGKLVLSLRPVAPQGDRFDEDRVGLDHLSFSVGNRAELDEARGLLERAGVPHGEIKELASFGIAVLEFRDPDNIQLELTSPLG